MKWIVTCEMVRGVLNYFVENSLTGERRGSFDCEPWAQEMANELNRQEEAKRVIRQDPKGNVMARLEALEVAETVLGKNYTTGDLHRWADKE